VALPHGNAKSKEKLESDFVMTRKSKRIEMKERPGKIKLLLITVENIYRFNLLLLQDLPNLFIKR
jgi:hypothetical protein